MAVDVKKTVLDLLRGTKATTGQYGFGDFSLDTDSVLSTIYTSDSYTDAERENIKSNFAKFNMDTFVRGEFVRSRKELPCICIARTGEQETNAPLGRALGSPSSFGNSFQAGLSRGGIHTETLRLEVRAAGAASGFIRDAIYHGLRWLVTQGMHYLHQRSVTAPMWVDGRDGDMPGEQETHIIQIAQATLRYKVERKATRVVSREGVSVHSNFADHGGGVSPQELIDRG